MVGPLTGYVYALGCDGNQGNVQVYALDPASGTVVAQLPLPGAVGGGTAFAPVAYATSGSASEERLVVGLVGNGFGGATELAVLKADVANASFATLWTVPASAVWWAGLAAPDSGGLFLVGVGEAVSGSRAGTELFAVDANAASAPVLIHQTIDNALIGVQRASTVVSGGRIYLTTSSTLSDYGASSGNSPSFLREYVLGGTPPAFSYAWGAPFGSGDLAYRWPLAVTSSTDMLAVDAFDPNGERVLTQGCIPASFPTDGTRATCTNAGLWELDSANGNWTGEVWGSTQRVGPVVIGSDGHVVIGANVQSGNSTKYVVQAFARARPGTPLWTWNVPTLPSGQTAIDPTAATLLLQRDGTVIVQSPNALAEIDPSRLDANGFAATAWVYRPGGPYAPSPFPSYSFGAPFVTAVEDGAGRYFTFYADGTLHALGLPHPSAPDLDAAGKAWPMARHDAGGQQRLGARP